MTEEEQRTMLWRKAAVKLNKIYSALSYNDQRTFDRLITRDRGMQQLTDVERYLMQRIARGL